MSAGVQSLIDDWLDDGDSALAERLTVALRADAAARRQLVESALLEAALHRIHVAPPAPIPRKHWPRFRWPPGTLPLIGIVVGLGALTTWIIRPRPAPSAILPMLLFDGAGGSSQITPRAPIRIPPGSMAAVGFNDGSTIHIDGGSVLQIVPLPDNSGAVVRMDTGSARFHLKLGCRSFHVITGVGDMQALGPEFAVSMRQNPPTMEVRAYTGARVMWHGHATTLNAGQVGMFPQ